MKTVMVLFGGWAVLGETITQRQVLGMAVAVAGMILYGYFVTKCALLPFLSYLGFLVDRVMHAPYNIVQVASQGFNHCREHSTR